MNQTSFRFFYVFASQKILLKSRGETVLTAVLFRAMEFRQIEYFRTVAEFGSVSQAAKHLGMTQPPLSSAISRLEQELGVQLFKRTAKGVVPTNAGVFLLERGSRLINERDRLKLNLGLMGEGVVGELRIGVEPMVINELVAQVMAEFIREAPDVRVSLQDVSPGEMLLALQNGSSDLAMVPFAPERYATFVRDSFNWIKALNIELKLAVPNSRQDEQHEDGTGWGRWILPHPIPAFPGIPELVTESLSKDESFRQIYVSSPQTAIPFVAAGLGVALVTERMAEGLPGIALLPAPGWAEAMQCTVLWRKGTELTPVMKRWLDVTASVSERRWGLREIK